MKRDQTDDGLGSYMEQSCAGMAMVREEQRDDGDLSVSKLFVCSVRVAEGKRGRSCCQSVASHSDMATQGLSVPRNEETRILVSEETHETTLFPRLLSSWSSG